MSRDYNITFVSGSQSGDEHDNSRAEKKKRVVDVRYAETIRESQAMIRSRQYATSLAPLKAAIKLNPRRYEAYLLAGIALMRLGQFARAVDVLTQSIDINPGQNSSAYYERGCAKVKQGLPAMSDFDYAIRQRPAYPEALYQRALIYLDQVRRFACHNDLDRAEQDLVNAYRLAQIQGKTTMAVLCAQMLGEIRLLPKPAARQPLPPEVFPRSAGTPALRSEGDLALPHESLDAIEDMYSRIVGDSENGAERGFRFFSKSVAPVFGINVLVWIALTLLLKGHSVFGEWILPLTGHWFVDMELRPDTVFSLDHAWKLLVYAFLHAPDQWPQLIVELMGLWFFGTLVANRYGGLTFLAVTTISIPLCAVGWGSILFLFPWANEIGSHSGMIGPVCMLGCLAALGRPRASIALFGAATIMVICAVCYGRVEWISQVLPPYSPWWLNFEMMLSGCLIALFLAPMLLIAIPEKRRNDGIEI